MKKINVITLGCSKNTVDSEHLMAQLAAAGYQLSFDSDRTDAKVVVINTCGFIGDAKQESIETILDAVAAKEAGLIEKLFVIGCLSERYADELRAEIPEVDEYFGANAPLVTAEIELPDEKTVVALPDWIGREVTDDHRYKNNNLAEHPFSEWCERKGAK